MSTYHIRYNNGSPADNLSRAQLEGAIASWLTKNPSTSDDSSIHTVYITVNDRMVPMRMHTYGHDNGTFTVLLSLAGVTIEKFTITVQ